MPRHVIDGKQYDVYEPRGSARDLFLNRDTICILDGPTRSGKTRAWLEKIHACLLKYPGSRAMFVRETLAALRDTVLETFENHVLTPGYGVMAVDEDGKTVGGDVAAGASRRTRMGYQYPNGSEIVLKGLSEDSRILSGEYEMIGICQLEECSQSSLNTLLTRLSGRHMPYRQIIGDCNPGAPTHWIKQSCQKDEGGSGFLTLLHSTHRENPVLFDAVANDWTEFGKEYMAALWSMPDGFQKDRLLHGLWVSAEGARWAIDPHKHVFRMNEKWPYGVPSGQRIIIGKDWGSHAPFAALWIAIDSNKDAYVFREAYEPGLTADGQAERVVQMTGQNEKIHAIYPDPTVFNTNSGGNKTIADYYRDVYARDKRFGPVLEGERTLNRRKQGMATIDAMLGRDNGFPDLYIEQGCVNLLKEIGEARWWQPKHGQAKEDLDPNCADHAITALYYALNQWYTAPEEAKPIPTHAETLALVQKEVYERELKHFARSHTGGKRIRV